MESASGGDPHGIRAQNATPWADNLSRKRARACRRRPNRASGRRKCPLGYRNISGPDGKKIITTEPAIAPLIAKLFEWYARGDISLKEAARKAHAAGPHTYPQERSQGACEHGSHHPAQPRLYTGWYEWNGKLAFRASTRRWCRSSYGSGCRACSTAASLGRPNVDGASSPFGPDCLPCLRLRRGWRDQEGALRLLSLHRLHG